MRGLCATTELLVDRIIIFCLHRINQNFVLCLHNMKWIHHLIVLELLKMSTVHQQFVILDEYKTFI